MCSGSSRELDCACSLAGKTKKQPIAVGINKGVFAHRDDTRVAEFHGSLISISPLPSLHSDWTQPLESQSG